MTKQKSKRRAAALLISTAEFMAGVGVELLCDQIEKGKPIPRTHDQMLSYMAHLIHKHHREKCPYCPKKPKGKKK